MSFDEFALICTYSAISVLSQAKSGLRFFLVFLMAFSFVMGNHLIFWRTDGYRSGAEVCPISF
jgi:hypothetical protein